MQTTSTSKEIADIIRKASPTGVVMWLHASDTLSCTHAGLEDLTTLIRESSEFRQHEAVIVYVDDETNCLYMVCVHSTMRGLPIGGVRLMRYHTFFDGLNDCLALSVGMTQKNSYAKIWAGGAKSVIIPLDDETFQQLNQEKSETVETIGIRRKKLWDNYGGEFLIKLQGVYLVGEDVNLNATDMEYMLSQYYHVCCLPRIVGGAGLVSPQTAQGIFNAIKGTCQYLNGQSGQDNAHPIQGKKIILKGAGSVGEALAHDLLEAGAHLFIYDIRINEALQKKEGVQVFEQVQTSEQELEFLKKYAADVFSPNAKSGTLTQEVVEALQVRAVVGAENAQIAKNDLFSILAKLHDKGIQYIPEPTINYMGVFSAYQEHIGISHRERDEKIADIAKQVFEMLQKAENQSKTPYAIFQQIADRASRTQNAIHEDRYYRILEEIWEKVQQGDFSN